MPAAHLPHATAGRVPACGTARSILCGSALLPYILAQHGRTTPATLPANSSA